MREWSAGPRLFGVTVPDIQYAKSGDVNIAYEVTGDGPFAETKEAVGGFDIIACDSLEEAVEIAAAHPVAQMGTIEVRPLWAN